MDLVNKNNKKGVDAMQDSDKRLIDAIKMCNYAQARTGQRLNEQLYHELANFCVYICGRHVTSDQIKYINQKLNEKLDLKQVSKNPIDASMLHMNSLNEFKILDMCFGESDVTFHGQKANMVIELYRTMGNEVIELFNSETKLKQENLQRIISEAKVRLSDYVASMEFFVSSLSGESQTVKTNVPSISQGKLEKKEVDDRSLEELLEDFNSLTGLQSVKNDINGMINLAKLSTIRKEKGMKEISISKHMVFTGNPGTGKTTVARLLGSIYHKLGVLSTGTLVEVDRSGLVAGYTGQTAIKTDKAIKDAMGGILFIDEAYTLSENKGEGDFGQEAIETILKAMEDNRDDLIIIVAGYPEPMDGFLSSNPGLKSRFNKFIEFEDYSLDELMSIIESMAEKMDYMFADDDKEDIKTFLDEMLKENNPSFANARTMRNILEFAAVNQANRLVDGNENELSEADIQTIKKEDIIGYKIG